MRKKRKSMTYGSSRSVRRQGVQAADTGEVSSPEQADPNATTGRLQISAETGSGALPVGDVVVTVSSCDKDGDGKRDVIAHLITNMDGNTPVIEVPVAKPENSPYYYADCSNYVINLYPSNYYPVQVANVHVYENITSRVLVPLIPIMEHETEDSAVTFRSPNKIYDSEQEEGDECDA